MSETPKELRKIVLTLAGNADANPDDLADTSKWEMVLRTVGQQAGHSLPEDMFVHSVEVSRVAPLFITSDNMWQVREVSIYVAPGQSDPTVDMIIQAGETMKAMMQPQ